VEAQAALVCLRKSALLLETERGGELLQNQGWAALWIGEVLENQETFENAWIAYKRAENKWKRTSPPRSEAAAESAKRMAIKLGDKVPQYDEAEIDRKFLTWLKS